MTSSECKTNVDATVDSGRSDARQFGKFFVDAINGHQANVLLEGITDTLVGTLGDMTKKPN